MEEPYYLANFRRVIEDVRRRCGDLLRRPELERIEAFLALGAAAQRLYVRMVSRRGPWFRPETLAYPEVPDLEAALAELAAAGFAAGAGAAAPADLAALLRKDELEALLAGTEAPARRGEGRAALEARLLATAPERLAGTAAWTPLATDWARLLMLLFFGSFDQDLSAFVVADLGHVRYEAYAVDPGSRPFADRAEVDCLLGLDELRQAVEAGAGLETVSEALLAMEARPGVRPQRRYQRLLNEVGRAWERQGDLARALACYDRSRLPPSRERRVRVLLALGRPGEALELALAMAGAPLDAGEARLGRRFLGKLTRTEPAAARWLEANPAPPPVEEVHLRVPRHPSGRVEQAALEAARPWAGFHTENVLWNALFGLAFWDVVFAPVAGAFHHPYQTGPADLRSPDFAERRQALLAARLEELSAPGAARRRILAAAEAKWGVANPFVHWRALAPDHLEAALATLPETALTAVLRVMAPSPAALGSGFPDLFLHHEGRCRLWEVKGPGDTLRPEQERWLGVFRRAGVDARVAWVEYE